MTGEMWLTLGVGLIGGAYLGRWWAEFKRARVDMSRVWSGRKGYRS